MTYEKYGTLNRKLYGTSKADPTDLQRKLNKTYAMPLPKLNEVGAGFAVWLFLAPKNSI